MYNVKDYKVEISKVTEEDGGGYVAYIPELDCYGDGETIEQAIADVYAVAEDLIEIAREDRKEIPIPQYYKDTEDYSGKLSIRLPKTLHKHVRERAKAERCSINQLIITYIAMGIGDAFGRNESLMNKQEENVQSKISYLSLINETWSNLAKQQYDFFDVDFLPKDRGDLRI